MSDSQVAVIEPKKSTEVASVTASPADLIRIAVEQNMDVEKLSKLMDLQERWEANDARKQYFDAFSSFQSMVPAIKKSKEGHNYQYAPLGDIAQQIRPVLEQCQLSYRFDIQDSGDLISVTCVVSHRAGHQEKAVMSGAPDKSGSKNEIQARGSVVSYLQRYSLIAALGLTTCDADMDGRLSSETITSGQAQSIRARLEYTGGNMERFCHMLSIPTIETMPASKYAQADKALTDKEAVIAREASNASA